MTRQVLQDNYSELLMRLKDVGFVGIGAYKMQSQSYMEQVVYAIIVKECEIGPDVMDVIHKSGLVIESFIKNEMVLIPPTLN